MFLIHIQDPETGSYTLQAYSSLEQIAETFRTFSGPIASPGDRCQIHELTEGENGPEVTVIAELHPYCSAHGRDAWKRDREYITTYPRGDYEEMGYTLHSSDERIGELFS